MWSDNDIDNAFRRLDPAEPDPTPFPLDAWLKLEAGLDQAVIDRAVRRRLWQFFAAEVAVVALVGLGWSLWPSAAPSAVGSKTQTVAATALPMGKTAYTKHLDGASASAAHTASAPTTGTIADNLTPTTPRLATAPPAATPAIGAAAAPAVSPARGEAGNRYHLPQTTVAVAPIARFHSNTGRLAVLTTETAATTQPNFGQPHTDNAVPLRVAGSHSNVALLPGKAAAAGAGANTKTVTQPEGGTGAAANGRVDGRPMDTPSWATSEAAIAGAASPSGGRTDASEHGTAAVATNADGRSTVTDAITAAHPNDATGTTLAPATANTVALVQPLATALPAQLAPTELTAEPLPPVVHQPRVYVGVVVAPDVSTVKFANVESPHLNIGLTLDYRLGQRLRLSTGLLRSTKTYAARRDDYDWGIYQDRVYAHDFQNVDGSCTVLDVPLNLRYDVLVRPTYRLTGSAGLSSFFMQHESYYYDWTDATGTHTWNGGAENQNRHLFSILNLSAGAEYGLNSRWSLQAEPYVKVPLAGVGLGKVKLLSAGVYFGLKYGF